MSEPKPQRKPKIDHLSSEYHKAHKQVMLWAGILFIWELVGIDLENAKNAEGNVGAIVKSLKSPQAVPWVLLVLVGYFLLKTNIEWWQCDEGRRVTKAARTDFYSAWIASLVAIALYIYQAISRIQFANVVSGSNRFTSVIVGALFGTALAFSISILAVAYFRGNTPLSRGDLLVITLLGLSSLSLLITFCIIANTLYVLISSSIAAGIVLYLIQPWQSRRKRKQNSD